MFKHAFRADSMIFHFVTDKASKISLTEVGMVEKQIFIKYPSMPKRNQAVVYK